MKSDLQRDSAKNENIFENVPKRKLGCYGFPILYPHQTHCTCPATTTC